MTDSIPQQAGPGAGAEQQPSLLDLADMLHAGIASDTPRSVMQSVAAKLRNLAAPLAVEDSRERCALTDESIDTLLASVGPTQGMRPDSRDLTLAQVRKLVRAAMAAASSGKEKME